MFCPKCGQQSSDEVRFCPRCGLQLAGLAAYMAANEHPPAGAPVARAPVMTARRRGMRRGAKLMFICGVLLPAAALLAFEGDAPGPLLLVLTGGWPGWRGLSTPGCSTTTSCPSAKTRPAETWARPETGRPSARRSSPPRRTSTSSARIPPRYTSRPALSRTRRSCSTRTPDCGPCLVTREVRDAGIARPIFSRTVGRHTKRRCEGAR